MQAGQTFIQTLLLQAMALYIHGPLRCKDLLGRIPNPHSCYALAAPQHAPGPRSDARSQCTPPGEIMHRSAAPHPAAAPATERPAPPAHLRSDRPAVSRTHAAHTPTQPRSDTQPTTLEAVQHPQPHTIRPPDSTKARPTIKPDRLFLLHDGTGHRPAETVGKNHTARPPPALPALPAASIFRRGDQPQNRSGKERTTSTTTAPHPTRAGPHWKPTADPAGSSNHHAHDQTAYAPAARPAHAAPVLVMGKPPGGHCPTHSKLHPDRPQISQPEPPRPHRRASEARHSVRHTARHFFKSKAQIRHILAVSHPL